MSDYHGDPTRPTARKAHRCAPCGYPIEAGEEHVQQSGFYEGGAYRNRYHQECWDALCAEGGVWEFSPGSGEPPERLLHSAPQAQPAAAAENSAQQDEQEAAAQTITQQNGKGTA